MVLCGSRSTIRPAKRPFGRTSMSARCANPRWSSILHSLALPLFLPTLHHPLAKIPSAFPVSQPASLALSILLPLCLAFPSFRKRGIRCLFSSTNNQGTPSRSPPSVPNNLLAQSLPLAFRLDQNSDSDTTWRKTSSAATTKQSAIRCARLTTDRRQIKSTAPAINLLSLDCEPDSPLLSLSSRKRIFSLVFAQSFAGLESSTTGSLFACCSLTPQFPPCQDCSAPTAPSNRDVSIFPELASQAARRPNIVPVAHLQRKHQIVAQHG